MEKGKEIYLYVFGAVIAIGEIGMILWLIILWQHGVSTENETIINLIYALSLAYHSGFMIVLGYFFGSSKSSADKTQLMSEMKKTE